MRELAHNPARLRYEWAVIYCSRGVAFDRSGLLAAPAHRALPGRDQAQPPLDTLHCITTFIALTHCAWPGIEISAVVSVFEGLVVESQEDQ